MTDEQKIGDLTKIRNFAEGKAGLFMSTSNMAGLLISEIDNQQLQIATMRRWLECLQWVSPYDDGPFCGVCGNFAVDGHKTTCGLAQTLSTTAGANYAYLRIARTALAEEDGE